ncbi:MAG: sigma-70 family RNA polymerase sigma factor [Pseudomonadota bacterium]
MSQPPSDAAVRRDSELMRRVGAGDTEAFRQIMTDHGPRLIRLAYGITGRIDEAEDVAQDSLLTLWRTAQGWQPKATIAAFLRTVATRKAIDAVRRTKLRADDFQMDELEDPGKGPEATIEQREDVAVLLEQMAELSERQRAALVLVHFENRSHRDAAEIMEVDVEAFSSLLARARRSLRQRVENRQTNGGEDGKDQLQT